MTLTRKENGRNNERKPCENLRSGILTWAMTRTYMSIVK